MLLFCLCRGCYGGFETETEEEARGCRVGLEIEKEDEVRGYLSPDFFFQSDMNIFTILQKEKKANCE